MQWGDISALLVPAGRLGDAELAEIAALPEIRSRIDLMVAWDIPSPATALALVRARTAFEAQGDATVLETALDDAFAAEMGEVLGDDRTGAAAVLRSEVDARNMTTALRIRRSRLDREPAPEQPVAYVAGGLVPVEIWERVAESDAAEGVTESLGPRALLPGWDPAIAEWVSDGDLTGLADRLQRATTAAAFARWVTGDVLGFDIPLAFTFSKEAEARNLHLVGRGIVHGIPVDEIEARLEVAA
jgi:vacuolar-type H+-ATPase subunit C/Vma6